MHEYEHLSIKKKRMMVYFIEATQNLLKKEGLTGVTIRKIATAAGYNSATLYNYFPDLDYLILFGSVCYLRDYISLLMKELKPEMSSRSRYETIYRCFNINAFAYPEIFYNMFFGKYSNRLGKVIELYYSEIFPDELKGFSPEMQQMLVRGQLADRDQVVMEQMVADGYVAADKEQATLEIIIALHERFIHQACLAGKELDCKEHATHFMQLFHYVLDAAKP